MDGCIGEDRRIFGKQRIPGGKTGTAQKLLKAWLIRELLPPLREDLERMKLEEGVYDFDDMLRIVEENLIPVQASGEKIL